MLTQLLLSMMTTLTMLMTIMKHPLSMGFTLIAQTLVVSMICGMMFKSFLFSYIIVMIMLSGALVLFIYMSSVASNEKFKTSIKILFMFFATVMLMKYTELFSKMEWNYMEESKNLIKMFNTSAMMLTIMTMIYLLFTMIVVSKISSINEGPLRMKQ